LVAINPICLSTKFQFDLHNLLALSYIFISEYFSIYPIQSQPLLQQLNTDIPVLAIDGKSNLHKQVGTIIIVNA